MAEQAVNTSRSKKIAKDFLIYAIGFIGSKLMTFLLLPLYAHYLKNPAEYGYYDLCLSACFLLMPIVTLQMRDGAFRFLLETKDDTDRTRIVTFINKTLIVSSLLSIIIAVGVYFIHPFRCLGHITTLLIVMSFYDVYAQTVRGLGNNRSFIAVSLISSFGIGVFSILFVVIMDMGIPGIFWANILARIVSLIAVDLHEHALRRYFDIRMCDYKQLGRDILRFSIPLLPAGICWWFIGFCNRYFITNYLSIHDSGIYGVASRLATVAQAIATVFLQTWQENAIQQYNTPDRNKFFSKIFNGYIVSFVFVIILYTFSAKIAFPFLFNEQYNECLRYIYPLCVASMFFALAGYFEIIYQCEKTTNRLVPPLIVAPLVNILLNWLLVPRYGIYGATISYASTYILLIIYRWYDTYGLVKVNLYKTTYLPLVIMIAGGIPFFFKTNIFIDIAILLICSAGMFFSPEFRTLITTRLGKFLHKRKAPIK